MLKKDNDELRYGLNYVMKGGDPRALMQSANVSPGSAGVDSDLERFKTPALNTYLFDDEDI